MSGGDLLPGTHHFCQWCLKSSPSGGTWWDIQDRGCLTWGFFLLLRERETQRWSGSGGCSLLIAECCIGKTKLLWSMWWWYDHHDTSCIEYIVTTWSSVHPFRCPQASPPLQCPEWGWKPLSLLHRVILQRNVAHLHVLILIYFSSSLPTIPGGVSSPAKECICVEIPTQLVWFASISPRGYR